MRTLEKAICRCSSSVNTTTLFCFTKDKEAHDIIRGLGLGTWLIPSPESEKLITLIVWCRNFSAVRPEPENSRLSSGQFQLCYYLIWIRFSL